MQKGILCRNWNKILDINIKLFHKRPAIYIAGLLLIIILKQIEKEWELNSES